MRWLLIILFILNLIFAPTLLNTETLPPEEYSAQIQGNFINANMRSFIPPDTLGSKMSKELVRYKIQEYNDKIDWQYLYALAFFESSWNTQAVGDNGCSYGLYQINTCIHDVTPQEARDVKFSTEWAEEELISNGFLDGYITYALARHQGSWQNDVVRQRAYEVKHLAQSLYK